MSGGKPAVAIATFDGAGDVARHRRIEVGEALPWLLRANALRATRRRWPRRIERDLSAATGAPVRVDLVPRPVRDDCASSQLAGESLDALPVAIERYEVDPGTAGGCGGDEARADPAHRPLPLACVRSPASRTTRRSRSPIAGRASTARACCATSCRIACHAGFHEHCVERIFVDLMARLPLPRRSRSTRASPGAAASTSIRFAHQRRRCRSRQRAHAEAMTSPHR